MKAQLVATSEERQLQSLTELTRTVLEKEKAEKLADTQLQLADKHLQEVQLHSEEVKEQAKWTAIAVSVLGVAAAGGLAAVKIWGK